jgi:hypothetical protein
MSFIKKHYEKVLLGAVLLGLFAALLLLPIAIAADKATEQSILNGITRTPPKPLPALDMSRESDMLNRVQSPYSLDFETTNRLFNPMQWQKSPDGHWIIIRFGNEVGPEAVKVASIRPLYFHLNLDSVEAANQFSGARYVISTTRENAEIATQRRPHKHYLSVGDKDEALTLVAVTGAADNPQLTLQINESGEQVSLSKDKPFKEVDGYAADLKYPPEGKQWNDQRVGAMININRNDYKVVVIDQNEVVISAESNQKKTTLPYQP